MDDADLLAANEAAIMAEYEKWVETTGYLVPPARDAWLAGWQAALNMENGREIKHVKITLDNSEF